MAEEHEHLHRHFGIKDAAEIVAGQGGLPVVRIRAGHATAEIYLHGAQVTSWKPDGEREIIFLSEKSSFQDGKAIRGGVPICFPWFRGKADDAKAPSHGLVRTRAWKLKEIEPVGAAVRATFELDSDESMRQWWPQEFHLEHRVIVGRELELDLAVTNRSSQPMRFAEALHTYYLVGDAEQVSIEGLHGSTYLDNMDGNTEKVQHGPVRFTGPTDSAYVGTTGSVALIDPVLHRRIVLEKGHSSTTVVWNPWAENAARLSDLGNEEWRQMACVEASNILSHSIELAPGAVHTMSAKISVGAI